MWWMMTVKYQFGFYTPKPMSDCKALLLSQSRCQSGIVRTPFENYIKKYHLQVMLDKLSETEYVLHADQMWEANKQKATIPINAIAKLTLKDEGTWVVGRVEAPNSAIGIIPITLIITVLIGISVVTHHFSPLLMFGIIGMVLFLGIGHVWASVFLFANHLRRVVGGTVSDEDYSSELAEDINFE
ncbi:MAG TPA: hypothetical protein PLZ51_26600 [Aggregatilineales bacterium]|nr:hypothetical protein [Aggregatilineales bacterium]